MTSNCLVLLLRRCQWSAGAESVTRCKLICAWYGQVCPKNAEFFGQMFPRRPFKLSRHAAHDDCSKASCSAMSVHVDLHPVDNNSSYSSGDHGVLPSPVVSSGCALSDEAARFRFHRFVDPADSLVFERHRVFYSQNAFLRFSELADF